MSEKPVEPAVEGPEEVLEPVREQAHEPPGLVEKVAALEAREKELLDRLARLQADFDNFRRRTREEAAASQARAKQEFVRALLPVLDNLDRALAHANDEGLKLLARQLATVLASQGLLVLDPTGEPFDAKVHEAIASEAKPNAKPGTVIQTVERGYALDGRVVRPARVIVAS